MFDPIAGTARGFTFPFKGLRFIMKNPAMWPWVAIPVAINTFLYGLFIYLFNLYVGGWLDGLTSGDDSILMMIAYYILAGLLAIVLILATGYTFAVVGNFIASPFNDKISEKAERIYTGLKIEEPFSLGRMLSGAWIAFSSSFKRLAIYLTGVTFFFIIGFFPPFGTLIATIFGTIYMCFFLAWENFDFTMDRYRFTFADKKAMAKENMWIFMGFGAGAAMILFIPLAGILLLPGCVAGATLLFNDLKGEGRLPETEMLKDQR